LRLPALVEGENGEKKKKGIPGRHRSNFAPVEGKRDPRHRFEGKGFEKAVSSTGFVWNQKGKFVGAASGEKGLGVGSSPFRGGKKRFGGMKKGIRLVEPNRKKKQRGSSPSPRSEKPTLICGRRMVSGDREEGRGVQGWEKKK